MELTSFSIAERRIVQLVADGHADDVIGARLILSAEAVEWTVAKLCALLCVSARDELVGALGLALDDHDPPRRGDGPIWVTESEPA